MFNPLNAELEPIRHLLALVGVRHIVHVSRIRVNVCKSGPFGYLMIKHDPTKAACSISLIIIIIITTIAINVVMT